MKSLVAALTVVLLFFPTFVVSQAFNRNADQIGLVDQPLFALLKPKYQRIYCDSISSETVRLIKVRDGVHRVRKYSVVKRGQIKHQGRARLAEIQAELSAAGSECSIGIGNDDQSPTSDRRLGLNLGIINSWEAQILTTNLFKQSMPFVQHTANGARSGYACVDARGWPSESPCPIDGSIASTNIMNTGIYPGGDYTFSFSGSGGVEIRGRNVIGSPRRFSQPGTYSITINQGEGTVFIDLLQSSRSDPIRSVRFDLPGYDSGTDIFYPPTMQQLRENGGFKVLRLMNVTATNNNIFALNWASRRLPSNEQYSGSEGKSAEALPVELIDDLANAADASPWITIPFNADDSYVSGIASELNRNLAPHLKVYVEYSNEIWNSSFIQNGAAKERGAAQFGVPASFRSGQMWTVYRSAQIADLFEKAFTDDSRLYFVLPGQAGPTSNYNSSLTSYIENSQVNPLGKTFNGLAIAAYVNVDARVITDAGCAASITVEDILNIAQQLIVGTVKDPPSCPGFVAAGGGKRISTSEMVAEQNLLAGNFGMDLIAYEGGQHLVATFGSNSQALTPKFMAANLHPNMHEVTSSLFDTWYSNGGKLFMFYKYISTYGSSGSWGAMQHFYDTDNYKWQALQLELSVSR